MSTDAATTRKRKYRPLEDAEILQAIAEGRLQTDDAGAVYSVNGVRRRYVEREDHQGRPCVRIYLNGGRRETTAGRLVWMIRNGQAVPDGYHVDHVNGNRYDNTPANLRLLEASINSSRNTPDADDLPEF